MSDNNSLMERKKAFEARTAQYLRLGYDRVAAASKVVAIAGDLRSPALDVGTGRGLTAIALASMGMEVISIDIDAIEQKLAEYLASEAGLDKRIEFFCQDASGLTFPDNYFGCAVLAEVLHHLENPQEVLTQVMRVLQPGGILILADFSPAGFELVDRVHRLEGDEHKIGGISTAEAAGFCVRKGLHIVCATTVALHDVVVFKKPK